MYGILAAKSWYAYIHTITHTNVRYRKSINDNIIRVSMNSVHIVIYCWATAANLSCLNFRRMPIDIFECARRAIVDVTMIQIFN